jgi:hypothetical protein
MLTTPQSTDYKALPPKVHVKQDRFVPPSVLRSSGCLILLLFLHFLPELFQFLLDSLAVFGMWI